MYSSTLEKAISWVPVVQTMVQAMTRAAIRPVALPKRFSKRSGMEQIPCSAPTRLIRPAKAVKMKNAMNEPMVGEMAEMPFV